MRRDSSNDSGSLHHKAPPVSLRPAPLMAPPCGHLQPPTLHFFDNASDMPRLIFKDEAGQTTINDTALCQRLRQEFAP